MLVVVAVLALVVAGLAVALARTRAGSDALALELEQAVGQRHAADDARRAAEGQAASARKERDDALERASRAKRDAAEVARRMKLEAQARAAAEAEQARLAEALEATSSTAANGSSEQAVELWALALAGARRTWEVSVAPSPGLASPLDDAVDELRAAIEIEVDAAREEAGAAIDLEWQGDAVAPPVVAVRAFAIVQELVARLAKASARAVVRVTSAPDRLVIEVEGTDEEGRSVVPTDVAVEHRTAPGRFELAVEASAGGATGERPGR